MVPGRGIEFHYLRPHPSVLLSSIAVHRSKHLFSSFAPAHGFDCSSDNLLMTPCVFLRPKKGFDQRKITHARDRFSGSGLWFPAKKLGHCSLRRRLSGRKTCILGCFSSNVVLRPRTDAKASPIIEASSLKVIVQKPACPLSIHPEHRNGRSILPPTRLLFELRPLLLRSPGYCIAQCHRKQQQL